MIYIGVSLAGTGIIGDLSNTGKILIITIVFIGRVGILTFGLALLERKILNGSVVAKDDLVV